MRVAIAGLVPAQRREAAYGIFNAGHGASTRRRPIALFDEGTAQKFISRLSHFGYLVRHSLRDRRQVKCLRRFSWGLQLARI
jgi:hypothetical protein